MGQPYVGEIRIFAGNFAPLGWEFCDGSLLPISELETLFNLIGTTYGGDGQSTCARRDLRCRVPVPQGTRVTLAWRNNGGVAPAAVNVVGQVGATQISRGLRAASRMPPQACTATGGSQ